MKKLANDFIKLREMKERAHREIEREKQLGHLNAQGMLELRNRHEQAMKDFLRTSKEKHVSETQVRIDAFIKNEKSRKPWQEKNPAEKLLEYQRQSNRIAMLDSDELKARINQVGTKDITVDEIEMLGAKMAERGMTRELQQLKDAIKDNNIYEPWKNTEEYKKLEQELHQTAMSFSPNAMHITTYSETETDNLGQPKKTDHYILTDLEE
ncbi:hypothetical protein SYNTR_0704 [Candidatus Syntrophocurvum alkaliphilum]|uniref:Uncharacterized protein n=1 Tax=Candidatus Syntrophocurvum alkaliphilum TaxID=2293317 RepID=A0A6I6DDL6_9FIRM|nr:hypothetical protein [Candidatus Syntrophocurvum alkaliphilum]QGT99297.1 hypothetical protein SYNTR_0704 [Candidatus Syntrophocurvum alkaliphilum]